MTHSELELLEDPEVKHEAQDMITKKTISNTITGATGGAVVGGVGGFVGSVIGASIGAFAYGLMTFLEEKSKINHRKDSVRTLKDTDRANTVHGRTPKANKHRKR